MKHPPAHLWRTFCESFGRLARSSRNQRGKKGVPFSNLMRCALASSRPLWYACGIHIVSGRLYSSICKWQMHAPRAWPSFAYFLFTWTAPCMLLANYTPVQQNYCCHCTEILDIFFTVGEVQEMWFWFAVSTFNFLCAILYKPLKVKAMCWQWLVWLLRPQHVHKKPLQGRYGSVHIMTE